MDIRNHFVGAACSLPGLPIGELLGVYRELGITKFEGYSSWSAARLDYRGDPREALSAAERFGIRFTSYHLPAIGPDIAAGVAEALMGVRFAAAIGAQVALYKAASKEIYAALGTKLLDAIDEEGLPVTLVLQNHAGSAIETVADFEDVLRSVGDSRLKCVLEVGHFQRKNISWRSAWDELGDRVALIHVNDIRDGKSVLYGTGEVDFHGLMQHVKHSGYGGDIVVELELADSTTNPSATIADLSQAVEYLENCYRS